MARSHKLETVRKIRISPGLDHSAKLAGKKLHVTDAEALRLAAEVGFEVLRVIDYDVAGAIVQDAIRRLAKQKVE